jgi:tRNA modification GTPase
MLNSHCKTSHTSTTVFQLTGPGRAAVAVLAVAGPDAVEAVDRHFFAANGQPLTEQKVARIIFGHWDSPSGEELVLCRRDLQSVEIHCHGGLQAASRIHDRLTEEGCQSADWPTWISRQTSNRLQSEAQEAVAHALTRRTVAILLDQIDGALQREVLAICGLLRPGTVPSETKGAEAQIVDPEKPLRRIEILLKRAEVGSHLTRPWHLLVAGRPNVGKSSLVNAIVGYARSIVFDVPGTTRDVVTARAAIDGWPVWIEDTAGMQRTSDPIEREGIELARQRLATTDLLVWVLAAPEIAGLTGSESGQSPSQICRREIGAYIGELADKLPLQVVVNKIDLCAQESHTVEPFRASDCRWQKGAAVSYTSATGGIGIEPLISTLAQRLVPENLEPGDAVPINGHQRDALFDAQRALRQGDCLSALTALESLLRGDIEPRC